MGEIKKLNIGSHNKKLKGYINVDALDLPNVDVVCDLTKTPWKFDDNSIDEIVAVEFLEHLSFKYTSKVLYECFRILKKGGKLHIQVPDCGAMMEAYVNDAIDYCIPHKGDEDFISLIQKKTRKKVNPDRWLYAFCGAQKHEFDFHRMVFTRESLENYIKSIFRKYSFKVDRLGWKLKVNCFK